ncbi:MAG: SRPBCC domain-containing protein [Candidatus Kryptoniota bacterium]
MPESIKISVTLPASPKQVYDAWLSSKEHSAFTGEKATGNAKMGSKFTAFGDYIEGKNIELKPHKLIVQAWRTTEFPADSGDSKLKLTLEEVKGGTTLTLAQSNIPKGQGSRYKDGWKEHYFEKMKKYFSEQNKR